MEQSTAAQELAKRMAKIAESEAMQQLVGMRLPNRGDSFAKISEEGLASLQNDKNLRKAWS
ncbi:MAG: hypothetical protein HQM04_11810 [Magnetococcales bacterium]|nr:hypothetical protein [Magnetococcales bacterium]MBF0115711.1 hypothetical protein [Magnetococcales bacterium]